MQLTVTGKQLDVGDALRTHIAETLGTIFQKYFGDAIDAAVVLSRDAHLFHAQVSVHVGRGILMRSEANADAPYAAFDLAADHVAKRLRRYKRRLREHHKRVDDEVLSASTYVLALEREEDNEPQLDAAPIIVAEMETEVPTLSVSEAVMRMDLEDSPALMFRNRAHGGLNMVYRRDDGNVGWVDPRGNRAQS